MNPAQDNALREHLLELLDARAAHLDFDKAIAGVPPSKRGRVPEGLVWSLWQQLEHMRICQWDIVEFSRNAEHHSPDWPDGYWPASPEPPDELAWDAAVAVLRNDLQAMKDLVTDPQTDLFAKIPHGSGQTILREAMLLADHNAYHLGQFVLTRRLLKIWSD